MKRLIPLVVALAFSVSFLPTLSSAQQVTSLCVLKDRNQGGVTIQDCIPVGTVAGSQIRLPVDAGTITTSIAGFTPSLSYSTLTATATSASAALPTNTGTVAVQNTGTTAISCTLGTGATTATANQIVVQSASTVFVSPGTNNTIACIDQTGAVSNPVVIAGGSGLGAGFGGGSGGGGGSSSITNWGGGVLGAMANYGTSPGAVLVPGTNSFVTNTVTTTTTLNAETTKVIGTTRNLGNAGAILDFAGQNAASPANSWLMGGQFNTTPTTITSGNSSPLQLDNGGNLKVNIVAGASSGAVAQGSTTSGQTGGLVQGAVTTAAPTYTTAQTNPLSLTTAGGLRTNDGSLNSAIGTTADAVCGTATGTCSQIALQKYLNTLAGTALPAQSGTTTNIGNVGNIAIPNGGATPTGNIAANNTTAVVIKAGAGTLYGVQLAGLGAAPAYLKIYNATSATCGSGTPIKRLMIPAASTAANGAGSNITFGPAGVNFSVGITYCVTTGIGDSDTTAPAASTFLVNLDWN